MIRCPRIILFVAAVGCFRGTAPLLAQTESRTAILESIVGAERGFARMSVEKGIQAAFLTFLSDSGLIFRPEPVNGKALYAKRPDRLETLSWMPTFADVAASGELGCTTGPWTYTDRSQTPEPPAYGYFFSIWRKGVDGSWKVVIDLGIPLPAHVKWDTALVLAPLDASPKQDRPTAGDTAFERERLISAERMFSDASRRLGRVDAYLKYLSFAPRLYRQHKEPAITLASIRSLLDERRGFTLTWEPMTSMLAGSAEFGYTYGRYSDKEIRLDETKQETEEGFYVRVWKKQGGQWKVALDIFSPITKK